MCIKYRLSLELHIQKSIMKGIMGNLLLHFHELFSRQFLLLLLCTELMCIDWDVTCNRVTCAMQLLDI